MAVAPLLKLTGKLAELGNELTKWNELGNIIGSPSVALTSKELFKQFSVMVMFICGKKVMATEELASKSRLDPPATGEVIPCKWLYKVTI